MLTKDLTDFTFLVFFHNLKGYIVFTQISKLKYRLGEKYVENLIEVQV